MIDNGIYSTAAVYDKRDTFNFHIVNFPYLCSNIPSQPAYGVYRTYRYVEYVVILYNLRRGTTCSYIRDIGTQD